MSNPSEGQPQITVAVRWDRVNGTFDAEVMGDEAEVAILIMDDEHIAYANDVAIETMYEWDRMGRPSA